MCGMSLPALKGAWTSRLIMIADATSELTSKVTPDLIWVSSKGLESF